MVYQPSAPHVYVVRTEKSSPQPRYKASYRNQNAKPESSAGTAGLTTKPSLLRASLARCSSNRWTLQLSKHLPVMTNTFQVPSSAAPSSVHWNTQTAAFLPFHIYTWTCWPLPGVWTSAQPRTRLCKLLPRVLTHTPTRMLTVAFLRTHKLVNQPGHFPLPSSSHQPALQRALFMCQVTKFSCFQSNVEKVQLLWFYSEAFHNMKQLLRLPFFF